MRIVDFDKRVQFKHVGIFLTRSEAMELRASLESLLESEPDPKARHHMHVFDDDINDWSPENRTEMLNRFLPEGVTPVELVDTPQVSFIKGAEMYKGGRELSLNLYDYETTNEWPDDLRPIIEDVWGLVEEMPDTVDVEQEKQ